MLQHHRPSNWVCKDKLQWTSWRIIHVSRWRGLATLACYIVELSRNNSSIFIQETAACCYVCLGTSFTIMCINDLLIDCVDDTIGWSRLILWKPVLQLFSFTWVITTASVFIVIKFSTRLLPSHKNVALFSLLWFVEFNNAIERMNTIGINLSVFTYKCLLCCSSQSDSGDLVLEEWKVSKHREADWVESTIIKRHVIDNSNEEDDAEFFYDDQPYLREFRWQILFL